MSTPFMAELRIIAFGNAPNGWALANGQFMTINQNQALFSLLGTVYGGNGTTTFALPNLQGRVPVHMGAGFNLGQTGGANSHTLTVSELPAHNHPMMVDGTTDPNSNLVPPAAGNSLGRTVGVPSQGSPFALNIYSTNGVSAVLATQSSSNVGGNQAHENRQPFTVLNIMIALQGIFPSQN